MYQTNTGHEQTMRAEMALSRSAFTVHSTRMVSFPINVYISERHRVRDYHDNRMGHMKQPGLRKLRPCLEC